MNISELEGEKSFHVYCCCFVLTKIVKLLIFHIDSSSIPPDLPLILMPDSAKSERIVYSLVHAVFTFHTYGENVKEFVDLAP